MGSCQACSSHPRSTANGISTRRFGISESTHAMARGRSVNVSSGTVSAIGVSDSTVRLRRITRSARSTLCRWRSSSRPGARRRSSSDSSVAAHASACSRSRSCMPNRPGCGCSSRCARSSSAGARRVPSSPVPVSAAAVSAVKSRHGTTPSRRNSRRADGVSAQ
ncbi:hypothetical protein Q5530_09895 [Saccharothrix sp. BKS2]|uniref:hypothetical protein n=1 Tax=Saccharothrix sp. BKS2 TaxID=3064400 RepID=UPI0039ED8C15